jgi:hypothetical protein
MKTIDGLRNLRHRGRAKVVALSTFACAAHDRARTYGGCSWSHPQLSKARELRSRPPKGQRWMAGGIMGMEEMSMMTCTSRPSGTLRSLWYRKRWHSSAR